MILMGLIKAAASAIGSTFKDQWKEAIRCEDMGNDILMKKVTTETGVITNKSTIIVGPSQCAIIYDNGRVIDATAEEGVYTFDTSSSPSFFAGQFGAVFKEMWTRFTYNGATSKQQAVFFFNIKEIMGNKFGTPAPVPYRDWEHALLNARTGGYTPMRLEIKCHGTYTFSIIDPALFMTKIAGTADVYKKEQLVEQLRSEVVAAFSNVLNSLSDDEYKFPALSLPSKTDEIKDIMSESVFDEPLRNRGVALVSFAIESVTLTEESNKKIDDYELAGDQYQQQGVLTSAYANAVQNAAKNSNGSMNGFMGIGMMNMAAGNTFGAVTSNVANNVNYGTPTQAGTNQTAPVQNQETPKADTWKCACGTENTGKFCSECGNKKPEENVCPNCKAKVEETDKFCPECGQKLK